MKKNLFLMLLVGLLFSCNNYFEESIQIPPPSVVLSSEYAIPVEDALVCLEHTLLSIAGDVDEQRVVPSVRNAVGVQSIKFGDLFPNTRSDVAPGLKDLFYVVEFANGEGSAVLGADKRVESIYAILDETVITPDDFLSESSCSDDFPADIQDYLLDLIKVSAYIDVLMSDVSSNDDDKLHDAAGFGINPGSGGLGTFPITPSPNPILPPRYPVLKQTPLLHTKWDQNSPFNDLCYNDAGVKCPAGCVAIACGQIFACNQTGETISIGGRSFGWDLLNECNYGSKPSAAAKMEMAKFIRAIGDFVQMIYHPDGSGSNTAQATRLFRHIGYYDAYYTHFGEESLADARNIMESKRPFYIMGVDADSWEMGHSWVIDGWDEYYTVISTGSLFGNKKIHTCNVHCNFGWKGKCDGYYNYQIFNTKKVRDAMEIDAGVGDVVHAGPSSFTEYLTFINY